jgi:4-hydroxy-3-methylbut-2-enyl diphosphate reductase
MKVLLVNPRGFCAGVHMAIDSLELALQAFGPPVYVYHEIVHNKYVVESFRDRGAVFVNRVEDIPERSNLLFSAHGVSPAVRQVAKDRKLRAIDATCPLVTKVHLEALRFANDGYTIVLIGHEGHDEVLGTMGEAPEAIVLVESEEDVDRLQLPDDVRLAYLTQTTLSVDDANRIIDRMRQRFPQLVGPPKEDICYATQNRQEAVRWLVSESDLCLVLGSQNSSNSQRLREIAQESGVTSHLIDGREDLRDQWFDGVDCVLMTAGASAPETVLEQCLDYLRDRFDAQVEVRSLREEEVQFPLPRELRQYVT